MVRAAEAVEGRSRLYRAAGARGVGGGGAARGEPRARSAGRVRRATVDASGAGRSWSLSAPATTRPSCDGPSVRWSSRRRRRARAARRRPLAPSRRRCAARRDARPRRRPARDGDPGRDRPARLSRATSPRRPQRPRPPSDPRDHGPQPGRVGEPADGDPSRPARRSSRCARRSARPSSARTPSSPGWSSPCCAAGTCCSRACPASRRRCSCARWPPRCRWTPSGCSSPPTSCRATSPARWSTATATFSFRAGPVFTNLLLADEINRTPPKTQASLLEAMEERQVTVDGSPGRCPTRSSSARRRTRSSTRAPTRCPRRSSTASCSSSTSGCRRGTTRCRCWPRTTPASTRATSLRPGCGRSPARPSWPPDALPCAAVSVAPEVLGYVVDLCRATRSSPSLSLGRLAARRDRAAVDGQGVGVAVLRATT